MSGYKRPKELDELINLIAKNNWKWTCNDHETCETCEYFNNPCDGSYNSTDPRNIEKDEAK